jgi:hypothetical protein
MSFKKKGPGKKWVTGKQRAELQKMKVWINSQIAANNAQPANARPISDLGMAAYQAMQTQIPIMLNLKS